MPRGYDREAESWAVGATGRAGRATGRGMGRVVPTATEVAQAVCFAVAAVAAFRGVRRASEPLRAELSLRDCPEVLAEMRAELASILRMEAEDEALPAVQRRLREIADVFECGQMTGGL